MKGTGNAERDIWNAVDAASSVGCRGARGPTGARTRNIIVESTSSTADLNAQPRGAEEATLQRNVSAGRRWACAVATPWNELRATVLQHLGIDDQFEGYAALPQPIT
jgi:hypothetical protein